MTEETLRQRIKALCADSSQTEVAKELGFSIQYIHDVINGRRGISKRLAKALGYDMVSRFVVTKTFTRDRKV